VADVRGEREREKEAKQTSLLLKTSGIQSGVHVLPGVSEDTIRFSFLSFKTYYLIH
jgi:hypothetical protein